MSGMLSFVMQNATPGQWLIGSVMAGVLLFFMGLSGGLDGAATAQATYDRSVKLWLADCQKPVEACAYDWDRSYTLRSIYREKASKAKD